MAPDWLCHGTVKFYFASGVKLKLQESKIFSLRANDAQPLYAYSEKCFTKSNHFLTASLKKYIYTQSGGKFLERRNVNSLRV